MSDSRNAQATLWNGTSGAAWVEMQAVLDATFAPIEAALVEAVSAAGARDVLDIGCGTGSTTLAIQRRLGAGGQAVGVDISEPMLALARARGAESAARFVLADPQEAALEPAAYDLIVSRFGVMFFDDPVRAFRNLRRATREDGSLFLIVWRSPAENGFMTSAERAVAPFLPELPARDLDAPGQFGFADPHRVRRILAESGWRDVDVRPADFACTLPESELVHYLTRLGPIAQVMREAEPELRVKMLAAARAAFETYVEGSIVRFTAACWIVTAR